ncbi:S41 family peptidase [Patescibacteria group bacterium]
MPETIEIKNSPRAGFSKKIFVIVLMVILISLAFGAGFGIGKGILALEEGELVLNKDKKTSVDFDLFWEIWDLADTKYSGESDYQNMVYGAIEGMVASLGDPYSVFMDPDASKEFMGSLDGSFGGIGAEVAIRKDQLTVVSPLKGSPAQKAGLRAGDIIIGIDDLDASDMTLSRSVSLMRGEPGTKVSLLVTRNGLRNPIEITVERATIEIESVTYEVKDGNIAYVEVARFGDDTTQKFKEITDEIVKSEAKKMIIDFRDNPGGYLDAAVDVCDFFLEEGAIVKEKFGDGSTKVFEATKGAKLKDLEIVVLINKGSASGSEIVAAALNDYDKGYLIGETTFGKGTVQDLEEFSDGSSLRLTVAHWLTPKDIDINEKGIAPDLEVKMKDSDYENDRDPQLQRALKYLKNK